jgi:hypothetical protein
LHCEISLQGRRFVFVLSSSAQVSLTGLASACQICIPYADPALLQTRQKIFELSYGFRCTCTSCAFLARIEPFHAAPVDESSLTKLEESLRQLVFPSGQVLPLPTSGLAHADVPSEIWPLLNEAYLERLSARFSKAAHGGDYAIAEEAGMTLLAYYVLIYPPNYPQIGKCGGACRKPRRSDVTGF